MNFSFPRKAGLLLLACLAPFCLQARAESPKGAFQTGQYRNVFVEQGLASQAEVDKKIQSAYQQLFYSDESDEGGESVFFPVGENMGFIKDIGSNDIRSEGMSYGMMIAVQMNDKPMFDKLWRFADTHMRHKDGWYAGYFAWHLSAEPPFRYIDANPAPDGEEYFAMALYFAHQRWGSGQDVLNYKAQADKILADMVDKPESATDVAMFSQEKRQILFVTQKATGLFTDPSYHLPAFYELFARWSATHKELWAKAAVESRLYFHKAAHPETGLFAEYANFDGSPRETSFNGNSHHSAYDAFRVIGNIAMDYAWFRQDEGQKALIERQLNFMAKELAAKNKNVSVHAVSGEALSQWGSAGQTAMLATGALASDSEAARTYVKRLWNQPTPTGKWRYYDGLLHIFSLLHLSGQYRIIQ